MKRVVEANSVAPPITKRDERPRVLIVDNNRDFTLGARLMLEHADRYVACEENDPTRALQTARSFKPDIILLDIAMPQEDGVEVAAQIESDWTLHRVPMVFLTGLVTRTEVLDGYRIQGRQVVAKPVRGNDLIRVIEENLPRCGTGE